MKKKKKLYKPFLKNEIDVSAKRADVQTIPTSLR